MALKSPEQGVGSIGLNIQRSSRTAADVWSIRQFLRRQFLYVNEGESCAFDCMDNLLVYHALRPSDYESTRLMVVLPASLHKCGLMMQITKRFTYEDLADPILPWKIEAGHGVRICNNTNSFWPISLPYYMCNTVPVHRTFHT